ncbi:YdcF family protein [Sphingomicrobium sediminis]|uniref:YdcF family protein n=1 Tax=Sphingomicrobium sediminis TaxID=2950949 RepID=A0A9X2J5B9_9SPHN|nr:YdcF family protein [Sphingomicrobium sediminis]MCM8558102.1 YdcF family protein [Sphingomicrobium sediminis]
MILRLFALIVGLYFAGFALFAVNLGDPAPEDSRETAAIVVLTGASGRIEQAIDRLEEGSAERLFIAGVDPVVRKQDLVAELDVSAAQFACCVELGSQSVDTKTNAIEARDWLARNGYDRDVTLVTSDWHMRRAAFEFRRALPEGMHIVYDAVPTEPGFGTLFAEYNKYVLRRVGLWVGL